MGVKEIPLARIEPGRTYVNFSHTIKGQEANMPALGRLMECGCQLIDYEKITDAAGRRLVFFGRHAGYAGMIDSLWALGRRLDHEGIASPFSGVRAAHEYCDLKQVRAALAEVASAIRRGGIPPQIQPCVCCFTGYGQVSQGAQEIFDLLPTKEIAPGDMACLSPAADLCYKVVMREEHLVSRIESSQPFDLQEYYQQPERYESAFLPYVEQICLLLNCVYWDLRYPRLITAEQFAELFRRGSKPRLRVVGDISCDVDGSLACTIRTTDPGNPVYVYNPHDGTTVDGVTGEGVVVLAVDFLPCELPVDASVDFSRALRPLVPGLARADFTRELADSGLPPELQRATIVYQGQLTEPFAYLSEHVEAHVHGS
jgi:alpha-aminoadipic semialdehyde synthase